MFNVPVTQYGRQSCIHTAEYRRPRSQRRNHAVNEEGLMYWELSSLIKVTSLTTVEVAVEEEVVVASILLPHGLPDVIHARRRETGRASRGRILGNYGWQRPLNVFKDLLSVPQCIVLPHQRLPQKFQAPQKAKSIEGVAVFG